MSYSQEEGWIAIGLIYKVQWNTSANKINTILVKSAKFKTRIVK